MKKFGRGIILLVGILLIAALGTACGNAKDAKSPGGEPGSNQNTAAQEKTKPFYDGKTIDLIVATKPGGGYDADARLIAPFLQKQLPGSNVIVRNVPGGGHIVGANTVWAAQPDGLTIGVANIPGLLAAQIRGEAGINFDLSKFTWLGRLYTRHRFLIARTNAGFDTIDGLLKGDKEFKLGVAGIGDGPYNTGLLMGKAFGLNNIKMIPGFGGSGEALSIMRGEVEGAIGGLESWDEVIKQGNAKAILAFDAKRYKDLPDIPTLTELVNSESGKAIASYIAGESELSRAIFAPPNVPEEITQGLRQALLKALDSEEFKQAVKEQNREEFDPIPGNEVSAMVTSALNLPPDIVEEIKKAAVEAEKK